MKRISILVPENSVLQAISDPQYLFSMVNQFRIASGKQAAFDVELVGLKKEINLNNGLYTVKTTKLVKQVCQTDLIIIPALFGDMREAIDNNKDLIPWIIAMFNQGSEVASLCVGAFLLASTGLLNNKKCSTHWGFQDEFRIMFPNVEVVEGSIITEEKGIYSSGGAHSYWNLLLYLVEKYTDRQTAILASKYFAVDIDRNSQAAYSIFQGQKEHGDGSIKKTQEYIEQHIQNKITVDELAELANLGRRSFERRFRKVTNNSVLEYINRVKIEFAKRSFESGQKNISEVMFDVGYTDSKAFRTIFKKITGLTPIEYKNKYNKLRVPRKEEVIY